MDRLEVSILSVGKSKWNLISDYPTKAISTRSSQGMNLLDFSNGSLTRISLERIFSELSMLKTLILSNNKLSKGIYIPKHYFIEKIILSHNSIQDIDLNMQLPNLKEIDISYNEITQLKIQSKSLEILDVSHNRIKV